MAWDYLKMAQEP